MAVVVAVVELEVEVVVVVAELSGDYYYYNYYYYYTTTTTDTTTSGRRMGQALSKRRGSTTVDRHFPVSRSCDLNPSAEALALLIELE